MLHRASAAVCRPSSLDRRHSSPLRRRPTKIPPTTCRRTSRRLTIFGERADFSHDGKRILFLSKTFGDAMEIDLDTKVIRNLTAHYPHHGYTRALYLANGDILLSGPEQFDPQRSRERACSASSTSSTRAAQSRRRRSAPSAAKARPSRASGCTSPGRTSPPSIPTKCPPAARACSRPTSSSTPTARRSLANQRLVLDSRDLPFKCTLETQNFRPPDEKELTFSAYGHNRAPTSAASTSTTKKVTNYSNAPGPVRRARRHLPRRPHTLVECDQQNRQGLRPRRPVEAQTRRQRRRPSG